MNGYVGSVMADDNQLTAGERADQGITYDAARAQENPAGPGMLLAGFNPASIVATRDGTWLTEKGQRSRDQGRSWSAPDPGFGRVGTIHGIVRTANGELGICYSKVRGGDTWEAHMAAALGNDTNAWYFRWSVDDGQRWSKPVQISLPGLTMGLDGTMFSLKDGRLLLIVYSQFLVRMNLWGGSYGTYRGHRIKTETEGHFGEMEAVRVYYSDDHGRSWTPNDGWIMGWRQGTEKWTDSFVEATGIELNDGRIYMLGRSLIGRMLACESADRGVTWTYAHPTELMTSDSPGRLIRLQKTDALLFVWNQISREENRRGFRRNRASSAISKDEGKSWTHFKNLAAIQCLADRAYIPPDPVMTPIWGDGDVGPLPDDFEMWHYFNINEMGDELFIGMSHNTIGLETDQNGNEQAAYRHDSQTWIVPTDWFYAE